MTILFLVAAAALGVMSSTGLMCGFGHFYSPTTTCDLRLFWMFGIPIAVAFALLIGFPGTLLFKKFKLFRWWQFVLGATLIAVPFYIFMGEPFKLNRNWDDYEFDIFLYLGSGALSGLFYWFFASIFKHKDAS